LSAAKNSKIEKRCNITTIYLLIFGIMKYMDEYIHNYGFFAMRSEIVNDENLFLYRSEAISK